jgi:hypothetical protein
MKNITKALIEAKRRFPPIYKNSVNPHFRNKYASLDMILEAITEPLCNAGIVLIQPTTIRDGLTILTTQLIHAESGESIDSELIIPAQSDPQKLGSALTYYRRFSVCSILAIAAEIYDDGNTAATNAAQKKVDPTIEKAREGVRDCFAILEWPRDQVIEWSKKINPAPFDSWTLENWKEANIKALTLIDLMNSQE